MRSGGNRQRAPRGLEVGLRTERSPDRVTLRGQEGKAHRAAYTEHVSDVKEARDDADLVGHLGSAEDRHQRLLGLLHDRAQHAHLGLHQPPGSARETMRDPFGAGVSAVRSPERIVDIEIGELGQRRHQPGIVACLTRLVTDVLEHQDLARRELLGQASHRRSDDRRRERDMSAGELRDAVGDGTHGQLRVAVHRASQMRDQHDSRAPVAKLLDRRQGGPDASIVDYPHRRPGGLTLKRHVEVGAHENALIGDLKVLQSQQCGIHSDHLFE